MSHWIGPDRLTVEVIVLNGRETLRVRRRGFLLGYLHSVRELAALVPLEDLVEVAYLADKRKAP